MSAAPRDPSFRAVVRAEAVFNARRVLPYALIALFAGNAVLWWGRGPATHHGWATNSEFYIARLFVMFGFMTLPLFTALMMADPVNRDFDLGIDPLIFSKPIRRLQYLAGKFLGNFLVLSCCQAAFAITLIALQAIQLSDMVVLPPRVLPYLQHFIVVTMVSQLTLAALFFAIGTIARSTSMVYICAISGYFLYVAWQILVLRGLSPHLRTLLDPLLMNWLSAAERTQTPAALDQFVPAYDADLLLNRAGMLAIAIAALAVLQRVFARRELVSVSSSPRAGTGIDLAAPVHAEHRPSLGVAIPTVPVALAGAQAKLRQFAAVLWTELRLLRAERGILVLLPLSVLLMALNLAIFDVAPDVTYSGGFARRVAESSWIVLVGAIVFYSGTLSQRERELGIHTMVWSAPVPGRTLLLAKYVAVLALVHAILLPAVVTALVVQVASGLAIEVAPYLMVYGWVQLPALVCIAALSIALASAVREKLLAHAIAIGLGSALFYLYSQGFNHWLYNPTLHESWTYGGLAGQASRVPFGLRAIYLFAVTIAALILSIRSQNVNRRA